MQVLEILKKNGAELYPEDLAFFEAELDTGDYPLEYIDQCKDLIAEIRNQKKQAAKPKVQDVIPHNILVDPDKLVPGAKPKEKTPQERLNELTHALNQMRTATNYKTRFKQYLADHPEIDEGFIDQNIAVFQPGELESILMVMPLSEIIPTSGILIVPSGEMVWRMVAWLVPQISMMTSSPGPRT